MSLFLPFYQSFRFEKRPIFNIAKCIEVHYYQIRTNFYGSISGKMGKMSHNPLCLKNA